MEKGGGTCYEPFPGPPMVREGRRYLQSSSRLLLAVTIVADLVIKEFVLFVGNHLFAGVADGDNALDGQGLRETQKLGDIL